jgi:hypothetical protein
MAESNPLSSDHQHPSSRGNPGLDKSRDLRRRKCLQESSEGTGNGEHGETGLASGTRELSGRRSTRGVGSSARGSGSRSSGTGRVRRSGRAGNGAVGSRVDGRRRGDRGGSVTSSRRTDRVCESQSSGAGAGVGEGVAGADGDLFSCQFKNSRSCTREIHTSVGPEHSTVVAEDTA